MSKKNLTSREEEEKILNDFKEKVENLINDLRNKGFEIKAIATEAFRKNKKLEDLLCAESSKFVLGLEILTSKRECELLAANFDLRENDLLLEIGGGSVNAIYYSQGQLNCHCYSLGAYLLIVNIAIIIVSIVNGFLSAEKKRIIPGLIIPGTEFIDIYRGMDTIKLIRKNFMEKGFKDIQIFPTNTEIYLSAIK